MKSARSGPDEKSEWLLEASKLHKRIKQARVAIPKLFPKRDFVHPLASIDHAARLKVLEFLSYDTAKLVNISELERLLALADKLGIDRGNILYMELNDVHSKASELKKMICKYAASAHKTYAEAKFLFSEILQIGVWMEEANVIKKVIQVNKRIEKFLGGTKEDCLEGLQEITESEGRYIDSGFKKDISSRFNEIDSIQRRVDYLLHQPCLEFGDYDPLERVIKDSQLFPHFITNLDRLVSLYKSYVWVLQLGQVFGLKNPSLGSMVGSLHSKINHLKGSSEFPAIRGRLAEALTFTYSQPPISGLVQEVKFLFWSFEAQDLVAQASFSQESLERLLDKAPTHPSHAAGVFSVLKGLMRRAYVWQKEVERVHRQAAELRVSSGDTLAKTLGQTISQIDEVIGRLQAEYADGLGQLSDLQPLKGNLDLAGSILAMSRCVYRMGANKKLDLNDYSQAKELIKDESSKHFRGDQLFVSFKHILRLFNGDLKLLKEFHNKSLGKDIHATPDLFEPKFLAYAKQLQPYETIAEAMARVDDHIAIGELGQGVKNFLTEFKKAEQSLLVLANEFPASSLQLFSNERLDQILSIFEERKQLMHVRVYSSHLEELARYEWLLKSAAALASQQVQLETLERLRDCADVAAQDDKEIVFQLKSKIRKGQSLVEEVQAVLSPNSSLTVTDLRAAKSKMDNSPVIIKSLKRQVDAECRTCDLIERDFLATQEIGPGIATPTIEELKLLLRDFQCLRYRNPLMENTLAQAIAAAETVVKLIDEEKRDVAALVSAIESYKSTKVRAKEAEELLTYRQLALDYLNKPDLGIDKMDMAGLKLVEKCISNSLDNSFQVKLSDKVLKRKVQLLFQLEKKPQDSAVGGLIRLDELKQLYEQAKEKQGKVLTVDEVELLGEKLDQAVLYLSQMKKLKEEILKKARKVLFNYLDVSPEIDAQLQALVQQSKPSDKIDQHQTIPPTNTYSEKDRPNGMRQEILEVDTLEVFKEIKQSDHPDSALQKVVAYHHQTGLSQTKDLMEKTEKKQLRRELIKGIRNKLLQVFPSLSKDDAAEQARVVETFVYSQNKLNLAEYKQRVADYEKLIDKSRDKPFLVELITTRPLQAKLVQLIVGDNSDEFLALRDELEARRYLRHVALTLQHQNSPSSPAGQVKMVFSPEEMAVLKGENFEGVPENRKPDQKVTGAQVNGGFGGGRKGMIEDHELIESSIDESEDGRGEQGHLEVSGDKGTIRPLTVETHTKDMNQYPSGHKTEVITEGTLEEVEIEELEIINNSRRVTLVKDKKATVSVNEKNTPVLVKRPPTRRRMHWGSGKFQEEVSPDNSMEEREEPDNPGNKWLLFEGSLQFSQPRILVGKVCLISLSPFAQLSLIGDFGGDQLAIEDQFAQREFEKERERLRGVLARKEVVSICGWVWAEGKSLDQLSEVFKAKPTSVYSCQKGSTRIYFFEKSELSSGNRLLFGSSLPELESMTEARVLWLAAGQRRETKNWPGPKPWTNPEEVMFEDSLSGEDPGWEDSPETN